MKTKSRVTCYERFSMNRGHYPLAQVLNGIRQGRWQAPIEALRAALAAGEKKEAEKIKKSLPAFTLSARYSGARRAECLTGYNALVILDIDHLDADQVDPVVWRASDVGHTLFAFRSPSGRGVKIGVDPRELVSHALTVENHLATFEACQHYYEALLGVSIDSSGKDPGRLCFVSWDEDIYIKEEEEDIEEEMEEKEGKKGEKDTFGIHPMDTKNIHPGNEKTPAEVDENGIHWVDTIKGKKEDEIERSRRGIYNKLYRARQQVDKTMAYVEGNRNNYIYLFSHYCRNKSITMIDVLEYCKRNFSDLSDIERRHVVESAYNAPEQDREVNKGKGKGRGRNKPQNTPLQLIEEFLRARYAMRRNLLNQRLEIRPAGSEEAFTAADETVVNSLWCEVTRAGMTVQFAAFRVLLNSDFVMPYHPFDHYFNALPPWDGVTDYIAQVADTVETTQKAHWHDCFRRWIVAMVASALVPEVVNHTMLVLCGAQGLGKTTWCIRLIPPALRAYVHSGPADPHSRDIRLALAECLLINLDELGALNERELNQLKEMVTSPAVRERRFYGREAETLARCCSFCASANTQQILTDVTGSRRFLCFETLSIDYQRPVPYAGLFAQALSLFRGGFRYWFSSDEAEALHTNNENFRIQSPEEELLLTYFRKPTGEAGEKVLLLSSSEILQYLNFRASIPINRAAVNHLSAVLKKQGFEQIRQHNKRVFRLVMIDMEEVELKRVES